MSSLHIKMNVRVPLATVFILHHKTWAVDPIKFHPKVRGCTRTVEQYNEESYAAEELLWKFSCKKIREIVHAFIEVLIEGDTGWHQKQAFHFSDNQTIKFYINQSSMRDLHATRKLRSINTREVFSLIIFHFPLRLIWR